MPNSAAATETIEPRLFSRPDWLANVLRERILKGIYKPGDRLREVELQREFKLSNGPVREALQKLVADGILTRWPGRGVSVVELGMKEIVDLFQLRLAILELAAELAAKRADPAVLVEAALVRKNLRAALSKVKSGDLALISAELIDWILRGAGNNQMTQIWEKTLLQTRIYAYESMRRTAARTEPIQYRIIDAIVEGDVVAARAAVRDLTRQTLRDLNIEADI
ncbi:GntR family transcriptional regulator [Bradyrhizobium sp. dw_411]|uniref:GntR family transcriptional regulator n=1 Tax=Bradyrhizobium sp. dw_411 TaxID=2720082 RepID=UPI001BCC2503|nr:GntR family transcriptional regulator [Bradyrhizobium sp. dw_411]